MNVISSRKVTSYFKSLIMVLCLAQSAGAATKKSPPKPKTKKSVPAKPAAPKSAPAKSTALEYSVELANEIAIQGLMMPMEMHFKIGQLAAKDKRFPVSLWARNWMDEADPYKMVFLAADEHVIANRIAAAFASKESMEKVYQTSISKVEEVLQIRFKEHKEILLQLLADKKLSLKDKESVVVDTEKARRPTSGRQRYERTRQIYEVQLMTLVLAGNSEEESLKKLESSTKTNLELLNASLTNRNAQVTRYVDSYLKALDPHSDFMPPVAAKNFQLSMGRSFFGIGAQLRADEYGQIIVQQPMPNSPAIKAGVLPEDIILGYYSAPKVLKSFKGMEIDEVISYLRGEKDTSVTIKISRSIIDPVSGEASKKLFDLTIPRGPVSTDWQRAKATIYSFEDQNIASISAESFYDGLTEDIETIMAEVQKNSKLTGIIVDVSGNGGGLLTEAVETVGLFVEKAPVTQGAFLGVGPDGMGIHVEAMRDDNSKKLFDLPVLVKIDHGSASASEILAAAMQDLGRGLVVGEDRSFGKGTIQTVFPAYLNRFAKRDPKQDPMRFGILKFTTGAFYRVTGDTTQFKGVSSDIPIYADNLSYQKRLEKDLPQALQPNKISADKAYKPNNPMMFSDQMRGQLRELQSARLKSNSEILALEKDMKDRIDEADEAVNLNLNERTDDRAKKIERQNELLKVLADNHPTTGIQVSEVSFMGGEPSRKDISKFEDSNLGKIAKYSKDQNYKNLLQLSFEKNRAEIEALLPIFLDIKKVTGK